MLAEKKRTGRGGARPGGGRPRSPIAKRPFNAHLPVPAYTKLRMLSQKKGMPIGEVVAEAISLMWDQEGFTILDLETYDPEI